MHSTLGNHLRCFIWPRTVLCTRIKTLCHHFHTKSELCNVPVLTSTHGVIASAGINSLHSKQHLRAVSFFGLAGKEPWKKAVSEAEKIVGYPTSFMSLRFLLNDELASVALNLRKLVGTKHPLLQTAKSFLYDGSHSLQIRGLIVLLMSKAAGTPAAVTESSQPLVGGIHPSQRTLAEITEMIYTAFLVHRGVVDLKNLVPSDGPLKDIEFGNKIAVLSGDFLLANASSALARLKNTFVVDLISQSIDHMTQGAFTEMGSKEPSRESDQSLFRNFEEWKDYVYLSSGSLIGHSCKAAMLLTNHTQEFADAAFEFGRNVAWAHQLHQDMLLLNSSAVERNLLTSSLVVLHKEASPSIDQTPVELWRSVQRGSCMARARTLCQDYVDAAMNAISQFPNREAKVALKNLLQAWTVVK